MRDFLFHFLNVVSLFFFCYLALYATYLFLFVTIAASIMKSSTHTTFRYPFLFLPTTKR